MGWLDEKHYDRLFRIETMLSAVVINPFHYWFRESKIGGSALFVKPVPDKP